MTSSHEPKPSYSRRFLWLAIFIVVLFGGYSAAWFWFAGKAENEVRKTIAGLNRDGVSVECVNSTVRGFPFRIGLFCDRLEYEDAARRISASAGNLRTAAQVYQPMRTVLELDGPLRVTAPDMPQLQLDWELMHASARIANPLPERLSVETRKLSGQAAFSDGAPTPLFTAEETQMHLRPNGANVDLAGTFTGLAIDPQVTDGRSLPKLDGSADTTLNNGVDLVKSRQPVLRGQSGTIRSMTLTSGGSSGVALSGPWSIDTDGLVDADLKVTIQNPRELSRILSEIIPEQRQQIGSAFAGLALFGDAPTLPLKIAKGHATLGFISLGMVPAVK
ncbi:DUF2125 domain-containing protein [Aminobacter sp. AP02]|uniref:DUF2125 domain-containing protein n=1 Tax=Aminobacter sp. AP02 TaxID=2135737 RepID=UPI000D6D25C9|nr:DUF2125 domain-containing protein [Aminobacter sp. AP02]PWK64586.1 hypothetical protein C8K44_11925 [Aminobacter sp. AP02]